MRFFSTGNTPRPAVNIIIMTRGFEAIKRKFYSPLANKQTILARRSEDTELTNLNKGHRNHTDGQNLDSAKKSTLYSHSQVLAGSTSHPVAGAKSGVNSSCSTPTPSSLSPLGKRANSCNLLIKAERQSKAQRSTDIREPQRDTDDDLQEKDNDVKQPATLLSTKERLLLDIPLPETLLDIGPSKLSDDSSLETNLVSMLAAEVCKVQQAPPVQGPRLTTRNDSLPRLMSQLVPRTYASHEGMTGISKQDTGVLLTLLQEPSRDNPNWESSNEEYLAAEWSKDVSRILPSTEEIEGCVFDSGEQSPLPSLYQSQVLEFRRIWSSKRLQMAEVAACMMQCDFQFLSLIQ